MEPEDLPWPGELEEEEPEAEEGEDEDEVKDEEVEAENLEDEVVMVQEVEDEKGPDSDCDYRCVPLECNYPCQERECSDEEDDEAKAWLQAYPDRTLPSPSLPQPRYSHGRPSPPHKITRHVWQQPVSQDKSGKQISDTHMFPLGKTQQSSRDDKRTESWYCLPQEMDTFQNLDASQTRFNMREKGTEVTDFPSLEEGVLTQSENQVKEPSRDPLCSPLLEGLQGKTESDICTHEDDSLCCSLDENALVRSERDAEQQREVDHSKMNSKQPFSSILPPFVPPEPTRSDFHSVDLRMLRISSDTIPDTQQYLAGSTSRGGIAKITQSNLKPGITSTTSGDSDFESLLSLSPEDIPQFSVRSPQEYITGQYSDSLNQRLFSHLAEDTLKVSAVPELAEEKTEKATLPLHSYLHRDKQISPQELPDSRLPKETLKISVPFEPADQKTGIPIRSSYLYGENSHIVYQPTLSDSHLIEQEQGVSSTPGFPEQNIGIQKIPSSSISQREKLTFYQQELQDSHFTEQSQNIPVVPGLVPQKTGILKVTPPSYSQRGKTQYFLPQELLDHHLIEEDLKVSTVLGLAGQEPGRPVTPSTSYSKGGKHRVIFNQEVPDSHLTTEPPKGSSVTGLPDQEPRRPTTPSTSYLQRGKPSLVYQQEIPDSHQIEEVFRVSSAVGLSDQETGRPTTSSTSSLQRGKPRLVFQQEIPDSHLTEEALKVSSVLGLVDQETRRPITPSPSYSEKGKPRLLYQQEISDSHLTEETLKDSSGLGLARQETGRPITSSASYLQRGKPRVVYQQEISDSHLTEEGPKVSSVLGLPGQDSRRPITLSSSSLLRGKPSLVYQQEIPDSHLTEEALKVSSLLGLIDQETGRPIAPSTSFLQRGKPRIVYQQEIPGSHLTEEGPKLPFVLGLPAQDPRRPIIPSTSSLRGKPSLVYQQEIPDSHLSEEALKVWSVLGPRDQESGRPITASTSSLQSGKPSLVYQQEISDSHLSEEALKVSSILELIDQDTGRPVISPTFSLQRGKPSLVYQQEIPGSHLTEEALRVSSLLGLAGQDTGGTTASSTSSQRGKPSLVYQQEIPDSHLTEEALRVSSLLGLAGQNTGRPTASSPTSFQRGKPSLVYQQEIPDGHLTGEGLRVSSLLGLAGQDTGRPTASSPTSFQRGKPSLVYQQEIPDGHLTGEGLRVSSLLGLAGQDTGRPIASSPTSFQRGKTSLVYQQEIPDGHLTGEGLRVSSLLGLAGQDTGRPTASSPTSFQRGKPSLVYQQEIPDSHLTEEALKVFSVHELKDQETGRPITPSASSLQRGKPSLVYQQEIPDGHLTEEALKVSSLGLVDQETGIQTVPSSSYSKKEKPVIFYHQEFPDRPLIEEGLRVSSTDQSPGIPIESSRSKLLRVSSSIFYQQGFPESYLSGKVLEVSGTPGSAEIKSSLPSEVSNLYSSREKPNVSYQRDLPGDHLTEQAKKISPSPQPTEQRTGISTVVSPYSHREKPFHFHPQGLLDRHLSEESLDPLKGFTVSGEAEQKTGILTDSASFIHREKSFISSAPGLPDSYLPDESKVLTVSGPVNQTTGLPSEPSSTYPHREKSIIFYQQGLEDSHTPEEALKNFTALEPSDWQTSLPLKSTSYSHREKPIISYQQVLPGSHSIEPAQKVSPVPGLADQKSRISPVSSSTLSRVKPIVSYQQDLPGRPQTGESPKVSDVLRPTDQKIEKPTVPTSSYSHIEKPISSYQPKSPDLTGEAFQTLGVPVSSDKEGGISRISFSSYSQRENHVGYRQQGLVYRPPIDSQQEKPIVFHQQGLPDRPLDEEVLKPSATGAADQKPEISRVPSPSHYSQSEKPIIIGHPGLPDRQLSEEIQKVSAPPGISDQQKTRIPVEISPSYSLREKPVFYQQELLSSQQSEASVKVSDIPGPVDQKIGISTLPSSLYSHIEKPVTSYQQQFPNLTVKALKILQTSRESDQSSGIPETPTSYPRSKKPIISYQQESEPPEPNKDTLNLPSQVPIPADQNTGGHIVASVSKSLKAVPVLSYEELSDITDNNLKVLAIPGLADQKTRKQTIPSSSYSYRKKTGHFYPQEFPNLTEQSLKGILPGPADQKTEIPTEPSSSYLHKDKVKISTLFLPGDQDTEFQTTPSGSYSHREEPKNLTVIGADDQKSFSEVFPKSYRVKPSILFQQQLPEKQSGDTPKILTVPGTTEVNSGMHRELPDSFYSQKLPDKHLIEDTLNFPGDVGQAEQVTGLSAVPPCIYSYSEKQKLVSDHVQKLIDHLDSSNSSISSNIPLSSQADDRVVLSKPESLDFEGVGSDEIQDLNGDSRTLKEIRTLLMEAENIALKRCHFPSPLVPFRDVSDISIIQAKKVVCFKEPASADEYNDDLPQSQPFRDESPSSKSIQKDISTQTSQKYERGVENREFISSASVMSPRQGAESKMRMTLDETLRRYKSARSVKRSDPHICRRTIGNKIVIPMMTILKNDSSSDASSCSWDSNSLESVSDVFLNLFPYASPKTSMTNSKEEEGVSESDDDGSSVDSLATRVKSLLKCESSLNHAKQILRNAEKEECRVRARAWNLKFNLAREYECGYSISELNEDDRKKVEEIKEKFFVHGRTTDMSKCLQNPREVECNPEAVCSHIIIESHEKGCFSTVTAEQPQLDSDPCAVRFGEPSEIIRGQQSPSSWRARQINLCRSLDQSSSNFNVWNSLQFQSHAPFQNFTADDFRISKGLQMSFHENMNPWLLELEEPECVFPEEIDCPSQMLLPEPMKQVTTSITFASHQHSNCFSDSSVLNVDVTEGSQCAGTSWGVLSSHFTEEQSRPRDLKQKASSPSLFKIIGHSPDKTVTILEDSGGQSKKLLAEHFHQEKLNEKSDFKCSHSEPHIHANANKNKEVHFSDNHTLIRMDSPPAAKEKTVTVTPDLPSPIFLEQRELFEQYSTPHADSARKQHSLPPRHQDYVAPNLTGHASLEKEEKNRASHTDHKPRDKAPFMQGQDCKASNTPHSIFLEQRELFEKSKVPDVHYRMRKDHHTPLPQGQEYVGEKKNQRKSKSQVSNTINVETSINNAVPQSTSSSFTVVTSAPTPPSNKKALSCVRITLGPKTSSKLDSGAIDKRFPSLDSASKTRMNREFNSDLQKVTSKSLDPTSKLLVSKPKTPDQETLSFIKPPSDLKVAQAPLPDNNLVTQDSKTKPLQNSQIVTSRETQVNISDLERYHNSDGAPLPESADRPPEEVKTSSPAFSGKLSSDAVTQITTESPDKTLFSSEIFITDKDFMHADQDSRTQKSDKSPIKFASSSSIQKISVPHGPNAQPLLLPYKPSATTNMYYVQQVGQTPGSLASKSDTTIESSHSGSNDAIAPDFPAQALGTRDEEEVPVNIKHAEGIYSKRAVSKVYWPVEEKPYPKENAGSNDAIAPDFPAQALGTRDEEEVPVNIKHAEGIYSKRAVSKVYWPVEEKPYPKENADAQKDGSHKEEIEEVIKTVQPEEVVNLQKDPEGSIDAVASGHFAQQQHIKVDSLPDFKTIEQKEDIQIPLKTPVLQEPWSESKESLQIDIAGSKYPSEIENTTHSVFKSARFYIHHPVHLSNDQDPSQESLERNVFMKQSLQDFMQQHPEDHEKHTFLPPPFQNVEKTKKDDSRIENLGIDVNLENKEAVHTAKNQTNEYSEYPRPIGFPSRDRKVTPENASQHTLSLNDLWNKYMERQRFQKTPDFSNAKGLSLVERLDRLAKLLQNPITHSLLPSESTQDDSRGEQDVKEWSCRQQQQKNKLQKKKRYKCLEKCHKYTGDLGKRKMLSNHEAARANQIKIEQIKFDKYILRKKPGFRCANNTSSDSRPSEESDLLTDTATNILSTTTSPVDSDMLTQTDKEVTLHERSSSISTIDTARLIQAFGHERVCLSPKQIKFYRNITDHQRRYLEKRNKKNKKVLNMGHPLMTSEHTKRKHIQVASHMVPSDSISSSTSSFWSSSSVFYNKQDVQMLHKGIQAGNLEIVHGVKEHTRDVGMTFPTPTSSKGRAEEDDGVASLSAEKRFLANYCRNKKSRKNKPICYEGISWFIPLENVKAGPRKENLPMVYGPGISWFAPITNTKPWREPLREQNRQGQCMDNHKPLAEPPRPFVKATLQESLQLHRPDFISRSGERVKRLKLIVEERKLQNVLQGERKALFNTVRDCQSCQDPLHVFSKRGFVPAKTNGAIGKKEMILRSKRIYEQLPEVQKRRDEEKRKSEYMSYRLRAQLYKKKVTNQLLGRKVPWD